MLREDIDPPATIQHGRAHGGAVATNVGAPGSVVASSTKAPQVHFSLKPADGAWADESSRVCTCRVGNPSEIDSKPPQKNRYLVLFTFNLLSR